MEYKKGYVIIPGNEEDKKRLGSGIIMNEGPEFKVCWPLIGVNVVLNDVLIKELEEEQPYSRSWMVIQGKRLKASWSLETPQDLEELFGDAEVELTRRFSESLQKEIDNKILEELLGDAKK